MAGVAGASVVDDAAGDTEMTSSDTGMTSNTVVLALDNRQESGV
ncbi:hypothetical protein [Halorubrum sp. CBA1125]|nr:hypothetical protein [Halorubrum sp. CBA1125]